MNILYATAYIRSLKRSMRSIATEFGIEYPTFYKNIGGNITPTYLNMFRLRNFIMPNWWFLEIDQESVESLPAQTKFVFPEAEFETIKKNSAALKMAKNFSYAWCGEHRVNYPKIYNLRTGRSAPSFRLMKELSPWVNPNLWFVEDEKMLIEV